jgi:hypothetical protein
MSVVIAIMMVTYVSLPSRLIGMKTTYSAADKLKATAVAGVIGGVVCSPPYALGRIGLLMLGSPALFIPGIFVLALGLTLESGATAAVKAIKMSAAGGWPPAASLTSGCGLPSRPGEQPGGGHTR